MFISKSNLKTFQNFRRSFRDFFAFCFVLCCVVYLSAVGRRCFDADPGPNFTTSFTHLGKFEDEKLSFIHTSASPHCLIFLVSVIGVIIFNIYFRRTVPSFVGKSVA